MKRVWLAFLCWVKGHVYHPCREERVWWTRGRHPKYIRAEFRYSCCRCEKPTKWLRLSALEAWERKHNPNWSN